MNATKILLAAALCTCASLSLAAQVTVTMRLIDSNGIGKSVGTVRIEDSMDGGLVMLPKLNGLSPGPHGFHMHESASCEPMEKEGKKVAGLAAGGHYDPDKTGKHEGPAGKGHMGDLPALVADAKGLASERLMAPRLKVADLMGRSLMAHEGGDNYSDEPKPLGGGGARIVCGVVK